MGWLLTAVVVLLSLMLGKGETRSRGFEARLGIHGRLEKSDRASSATGYLLTEEMVGFVNASGRKERPTPSYRRPCSRASSPRAYVCESPSRSVR